MLLSKPAFFKGYPPEACTCGSVGTYSFNATWFVIEGPEQDAIGAGSGLVNVHTHGTAGFLRAQSSRANPENPVAECERDTRARVAH